MHDYVRGGKSVKSTTRSNTGIFEGFSKQVLGVIWIILAVAFLIFLLLRTISWSQTFYLTDTQTILFATKSVEQQGILLARFYIDESRIEVITLDPDAEIEVVGGYGAYRAQAMYPLLALEGKSDQFIRASLGLTLGMILDRTVVVQEGDINIGNSIPAFRNLLWQSIKNPLTSLSPLERVRFSSLLLDTKTSIEIYEQSSEDFKLLEEEFTDSYLMGDTGPGCSVALINTTQTSGLARNLESLLAGDKLYVVRTINEDEVLDKTKVLISKDQKDNKHCQQALSKLSKIVPDGFEKKVVSQKEAQQYRAEVIVKIGQDLAR